MTAEETRVQPMPSDRAEPKDKQITVIIYVLYLVGFVTGLTALAGVIMAHLKVSEADPVSRTHFQYQIRTFWIGLGLIVLSAITAFILIGYLIGLAWMVWTLVRCIKGLMRATENRPIEDPRTFIW